MFTVQGAFKDHQDLQGCQKGCFFLIRFYNTTHFEKLAERDFHFLFEPRGGEAKSSQLPDYTPFTHTSQKEQNGTPASI